jgi:thioesterase domain-containing protein
MNPTLALIHSPLVGPVTWSPLAEELRRRGLSVSAPELGDDEGSGLPFWRQHAESAARALAAVDGPQPVVLTGHSGAGPLLPAIAERLKRPVAAYLFVDAGIPRDGASRLDLLRHELPEAAAQLQESLAAGGRFPQWRDQDLQTVLPDAGLRRAVLASLRPRALAFMDEPIPVFPGWPDAPCGYLRFRPGYAVPAAEAAARGWACREIDGGHFHMLVEPAAVAEALLGLIAHMRAA